MLLRPAVVLDAKLHAELGCEVLAGTSISMPLPETASLVIGSAERNAAQQRLPR